MVIVVITSGCWGPTPSQAALKAFKAKAFLLDDDSVPFLIGFEDIMTDIKLVCDYATKTSYFYISWFLPPTLRFHNFNTRPFDSRPSGLGSVLILYLSSRIITNQQKNLLAFLAPLRFIIQQSIINPNASPITTFHRGELLSFISF